MNIAIIGAGISGLTCAYLLQRQHSITVFEAGERSGGHTATQRVQLDGRDYDVDTGFIVYNDRTYPNFIRLLDELGVESQPTGMSFSVSCDASGLEYNGTNLNGVFAQRRNLLNPRFLGMLRQIVRFNREAVADLDSGRIERATTLGEYLQRRGYGEAFTDQYLVPMGAAIWSSSRADMLAFPLLFFVRFFRNHGLLSLHDRPQWRVIRGGSSSYLPALTRDFEDRIHTDSPVTRVTRSDASVTLEVNGERHHFDQVVLACHSDQALALLGDASSDERALLAAIAYSDNDVVLHTDTRLLPQSARAWACWNYRIKGSKAAPPTLTYNMNLLQGIKSPHTFCVTLNDTAAIDPQCILGRYRYSHPQFSLAGVAAAQRWESINGVRRTWYCGAYWANGFHEDGCTSGIRVARALGVDW